MTLWRITMAGTAPEEPSLYAPYPVVCVYLFAYLKLHALVAKSVSNG